MNCPDMTGLDAAAAGAAHPAKVCELHSSRELPPAGDDTLLRLSAWLAEVSAEAAPHEAPEEMAG